MKMSYLTSLSASIICNPVCNRERESVSAQENESSAIRHHQTGEHAPMIPCLQLFCYAGFSHHVFGVALLFAHMRPNTALECSCCLLSTRCHIISTSNEKYLDQTEDETQGGGDDDNEEGVEPDP